MGDGRIARRNRRVMIAGPGEALGSPVVAADDQNPEGAAGAGAAPVSCSACRGTGKVISNLGGTGKPVECPWCDGAGVRLPDHDAQGKRRGAAEDAGDESEPPAPGGDEAA